jgi:hypothetical protein
MWGEFQMSSPRARGLWSRALIVVVLVGVVFTGVPVGQPFSNGQWPGLATAWQWLGSLLPDPGEAAADPAPARQQPPEQPPKRVRELPESGGPAARVFAMSDGTYEAELSPQPRRYKDSAGVWRDIDTTVREQAHDGYRFGSDRNGFAARFGERTSRLARFEYAGKNVALGTDTAEKSVAPKVEGSKVTYPGLFDGADVQYVVTPEGLKENIVLAKPVADPTFRFTLQMAGVVARPQPDGSIAFFPTETPDGPPVFTIPRPFMLDAKDDAKSPHGKVFSDKVTQTVEQHGANITITIKADKGWLDARERQYPVVIDPTIVLDPTPTTGQDAQIWSDSPTRADGLDYRLSVGTDPWGIARSLLKFDTSVVPAGTSLTGAKLQLYYDNELYTDVNDVTIEARRVTQSWSEDTVTWNSINAASAEAGLSTVVKRAGVANVWHDLDVRNIAQSWVSGSVPNYGVMVKATNEALSRGGAVYQAAEFAYNGETVNRPKLVLTYGRPSVNLQPPETVTATGAELSWPGYVDPDPLNPNDDVVELQVHRTVFQSFTPSRYTLIAPLAPNAT